LKYRSTRGQWPVKELATCLVLIFRKGMYNMKNLSQNWKIIFTIAAIALLISMLWMFRVIIAYVVIAIVISFICEPVAEGLTRIRIRKWRLPDWARAMVALTSFLLLIILLVVLFSPLITSEIKIISEINSEELSLRIDEQVQRSGYDMSKYTAGGSPAQYAVQYLQRIFSAEWLQSTFNELFGVVGNAIIGLFAVLFIAFFFLKDGFLFSRIMLTITPDNQMSKIKVILTHSHGLLRRYFLGVALQSLIMACMVGVSLYALGVQNAFLIGLFAGMVNVIPYLGPLLGASLGMLIALTTSLHLDFEAQLFPLLFKVALVFVCAQIIDAFVVQPNVLGSSVKAHPLEIFIVILMAGTIGGVVGMVLAIPVYTILRVIAREFLSEYKVVESLTRPLKEED
jgi:predicted PurR-regulated permease PerM